MIRYRTESFSGTGIRDAASILAFETIELGNADIAEYILEKEYIKDETLKKELLLVAEYYSSDSDTIPGYLRMEPESEEGKAFFQKILKEISSCIGKHIRYALWLADGEQVTNRDQYSGGYGYDMGKELNVDAYETSDVILCELGTDGTLYGYEEYPIPEANK